MNNFCVCCGAIIPEGRMVCPICEMDADEITFVRPQKGENMKTGKGLAEYAIAQLGKPYWWGTFGQTANASLLAAKRAQYPSYYQANDFQSQFGKKVHDCVGLVKEIGRAHV